MFEKKFEAKILRRFDSREEMPKIAAGIAVALSRTIFDILTQAAKMHQNLQPKYFSNTFQA